MEKSVQSIDVEKIMIELRESIEKRGYEKKELVFADIDADNLYEIEGLEAEFNLERTRFELNEMNRMQQIQCWKPLYGNPLKVFFKKIMRKLMKFYIEPVVSEQDQFNHHAVIAVAQLSKKCEEDQQTINELERRIAMLESKINKMGETK